MEKRSIIIILVVTGLSTLVLLVGLLYNRYRTKQRYNKHLEKKQKEINENNIALKNSINENDKLIADKNVLLKKNVIWQQVLFQMEV